MRLPTPFLHPAILSCRLRPGQTQSGRSLFKTHLLHMELDTDLEVCIKLAALGMQALGMEGSMIRWVLVQKTGMVEEVIRRQGDLRVNHGGRNQTRPGHPTVLLQVYP